MDCINTISLSNHPDNYNCFKITYSIQAADLDKTIEGLEANQLLNYKIVITGYTRTIELLKSMADAIVRVQK